MCSMELHSMELHSLNCCLSTGIKLNMNIIFFKYQWKYITTLLMHMLVVKNTANNTMYIVQELHTFFIIIQCDYI